MDFDVIVVGAGPGGSSLATFLSRQGFSILLLDKAVFPRDKVCGDGITPQALSWLDLLGCADEVLGETNSCITSGDIYVNGEHILTGGFPQDSEYPGFCTLLERKRLDHILLRNAIRNGAVFKPDCFVEEVRWLDDGVVVSARTGGRDVNFKGKLLIGADGANSIVSRSMGNVLREGATAVSVRAYYNGVEPRGSGIEIYFDERFFPGYGWVFVDDGGKANVGLGYAFDRRFPVKGNIKGVFKDFVETTLKDRLKGAAPDGAPAGWWASFFRPRSMAADRVMLIGDAANLIDPINGAGIHKAMESAYMASLVAVEALTSGNFSKQSLQRYEEMWRQRGELDWRVGEFILSAAKNPNLKEFYLMTLKAIANVAKGNERFQNFCGGIFTGTTPASRCISPFALLDVVPFDPGAWLSAMGTLDGGSGMASRAVGVLRDLLKMTARVAASPGSNLGWGLEMLNKAAALPGCYASSLNGRLPR